jgi:hypothetical protein
MLIIFFAEVHPFGSVTAEPIAVDIVSPEEVLEAPTPLDPSLTFPIPPKPEIQVPLPIDLPSEAKSAAKSTAAAKSAASAPPPPPPPAAASQAAASPQKQAALQPSHSAQQQAAAPPQQQPPPQQQSPPPQAQPQQQPPQPPAQQPPPEPQQLASGVPLPPAIPQEPDVSVKYHVSLGLPATASTGDFDAPASKPADIASSFIADFRNHLKTCARLPKSVAPSDDVRIKLRVSMTPDGKLIGEPILIEASASMKGPLLMRSAMSALEACQPYAMLPPDKYGEWKNLDLVFTPRDFTGG